MESLITVGSISNLLMAVYLIGKYFFYGTDKDIFGTILDVCMML